MSEVQAIAEFLTDKSLSEEIRGILLAFGPSEPVNLLRFEELAGKSSGELAASLWRSADLDAQMRGRSALYTVFVIRERDEEVFRSTGAWQLVERHAFRVEIAKRVEADERNAMLFTAREQNERQTALLLQFAAEVARKNQAELDRLISANLTLTRVAKEATDSHMAGVRDYAQAMVGQAERDEIQAARRSTEMTKQAMLRMGEVLFPVFVSKAQQYFGTGAPAHGMQQSKDVIALLKMTQAQMAAITPLLDMPTLSVIVEASKGELTAEVLPVAISRAMMGIDAEKANKILEILGPEEWAAGAAPNELQDAFRRLWRTRDQTLEAKAKMLGAGNIVGALGIGTPEAKP